MASTLVLNAPSVMTNPMADTPKLRLKGDTFVITSDSFNSGAAAALASRSTDAAMGGDSLPYTFLNPGGWGITSGRLTRGTADGTANMAVQLPAARSKDVTASCKVVTLPSVANPRLYLVVRRDNPTGPPQSQVRLGIYDTGMSLNVYIGGASETVSGSNTAVAAGDVVGLREYNGLVEVLRNGVVVKKFQYPAGTFSGDYAGFTLAGTESFVVDDFVVTETIQ